MDSIYYYEFDLSMSKLSCKFDTIIDIININSCQDILVNESAKDVFIKIKDTVKRYIKFYLMFLENMKEIFDLYKSKRSINRNLKLMKKAIKKDPDLAKQEINYRRVSHYTKTSNKINELDLKRYALIVKNLAYRVETIKQNDINNIIDEFYKNIDNKSNIKKTSIEEAIDDTEKFIETIDDVINKQKEYIKQLPKYVDDFEPSQSPGIVHKVIKALKRRCIIIYSNMVLNIELLYRGFNKVINKKTKEISKKHVRKRVLKRTSTIYKNSKKIETIDLFGMKIDIYETDREIESVFTNGSAIYLDKSFRNLPMMYQLSTLYHELGHILYGHTGNNRGLYRDEYTLSKEFKKKIKKIMINMKKGGYIPNDDLIVYLLVETEADSFSVENLGKKITKKTLNENYTKLIKLMNMDNDKSEFHKILGQTRGKNL